MTTFPALVPSSRVFTPGEYPATAFSAFSGVQNRVRHSNVLIAAQLQLSFIGLPESDMLAIWEHYAGRRGSFRSFALPAEVVSFGSITDYVPGVYLWRYAGPGVVEDLPCGGHNVTLTLETVPPVAANVIGVDLQMTLSLAAGAGAAGSYAPGITLSITLSISTGAAVIARNGVFSTLALSLAAGAAQGDVSVAGADLRMLLLLTAGAGQNLGRAGIAQTITLSLAAGAADGGVSDPNFSSVELLLHMNGSNGSTTFTDSSSNALTVTANGNAQISTAQSKFGGASGLFDGNGDYLLVPADGTAIGTGNFTVEGWIRTVDGNGYRCITSLVPSSDNNSFYVLNNTLIWYDGGVRCQSGTFSNNVWYHVAVTRSSGTVRVFLDGTVSGTTFSSTANIGNNTTRIGTRGAATGEWFHGYIDEVRITKGVARYTANFTAPTAPFPDS